MKIVFCSNYMNHHQLYLSKALLKMDNVEYNFIASEKISDERVQNGWEDMNLKYDWIVRIYENKEELKKAKKMIMDADLVIYGSFPSKLIRKRILLNKIVFIYSERLYKTESGNVEEFKTLHNCLSSLLHYKYMNYRNVYVLCASAYTAYDFSIFHNFIGKCFTWGYFPEVINNDIEKIIIEKRKNKKIKILWCGRLIGLKHPEAVIKLAQILKEKGISYKIDMIGVGEDYNKIKENILALNLENEVNLLGAMPNIEVRKYMDNANIFLFTSDYREGWGVVLNEAMNSGCAIVANHAIGSVPFLIKNNYNGLIYKNNNFDEFVQHVIFLINNDKKREEISYNAYCTLLNEWNPENAAKQLINLYNNIKYKKNNYKIEGICSKAPILCNEWRKNEKRKN